MGEEQKNIYLTEPEIFRYKNHKTEKKPFNFIKILFIGIIPRNRHDFVKFFTKSSRFRGTYIMPINNIFIKYYLLFLFFKRLYNILLIIGLLLLLLYKYYVIISQFIDMEIS